MNWTTGMSCMAMLLRPCELRYMSDAMRLEWTSAVMSIVIDSGGVSSSGLSLRVLAMAWRLRLSDEEVQTSAMSLYACPL